jgi:hypothetical protein
MKLDKSSCYAILSVGGIYLALITFVTFIPIIDTHRYRGVEDLSLIRLILTGIGTILYAMVAMRLAELKRAENGTDGRPATSLRR